MDSIFYQFDKDMDSKLMNFGKLTRIVNKNENEKEYE